MPVPPLLNILAGVPAELGEAQQRFMEAGYEMVGEPHTQRDNAQSHDTLPKLAERMPEIRLALEAIIAGPAHGLDRRHDDVVSKN